MEIVPHLIFAVIFVAAVALLYFNLKTKFSYFKIAKSDDRFDNPGKRIGHVLKVALAQTKILRESVAGPVHVAIFWGFLVLLFSAFEAVLQGFGVNPDWTFLGPVHTIITFATDVFCAAIIVAIIISFLRRFVFKVKRLQGDSKEVLDGSIVLFSILTIVTSLLIENASHVAVHGSEDWAFRPVARLLAGSAPGFFTQTAYDIAWWIHIVVILGFANYLPFSKHFHVYVSIPNVYFSPTEPVNKLDVIDFEDESVEKFGVLDLDDLSWKSILDGYACTHCGRCTAVCPANTTGKELSPREIIVQIRERTESAGPIMLKIKQAEEAGKEAELSEEEQAILDKKFVGDYESVEALWQCTTCGACMQECPVTIEHVPAIVGMRRSLVMMESNFPQEVQPAFGSLETNGTPWQFSAAERADWAEGLDVPLASDKPDFDVLYWVGCAGSFDDRAKQISRAFAKLMIEAGVNFAILGPEEQCNGDIARRSGNEYLADMLIKMNLETLNAYDVKKIVVTCPHCYNTFKNEYPEFGGKFETIHHSELLNELIDSGKLNLKSGANGKVAYHDSCYLGRYNNMYDPPRDAIRRSGSKIIEPKRSGDKGFCCGAGGGRMFMEETEGKRVNVDRTEELLACGADTIALNCPFCMTMITDGVKDKDKIDDVKVLDIAEILVDRVEFTKKD